MGDPVNGVQPVEYLDEHIIESDTFTYSVPTEDQAAGKVASDYWADIEQPNSVQKIYQGMSLALYLVLEGGTSAYMVGGVVYHTVCEYKELYTDSNRRYRWYVPGIYNCPRLM